MYKCIFPSHLLESKAFFVECTITYHVTVVHSVMPYGYYFTAVSKDQYVV